MTPGTTVTLDLIHSGQQKTVSVMLDTFPDGKVADVVDPPAAQPEASNRPSTDHSPPSGFCDPVINCPPEARPGFVPGHY